MLWPSSFTCIHMKPGSDMDVLLYVTALQKIFHSLLIDCAYEIITHYVCHAHSINQHIEKKAVCWGSFYVLSSVECVLLCSACADTYCDASLASLTLKPLITTRPCKYPVVSIGKPVTAAEPTEIISYRYFHPITRTEFLRAHGALGHTTTWQATLHCSECFSRAAL